MLIVTRDVSGTSSSVAKERANLRCFLPEGHEGPHRDEMADIRWEDQGHRVRLLLCHEKDPVQEYFP